MPSVNFLAASCIISCLSGGYALAQDQVRTPQSIMVIEGHCLELKVDDHLMPCKDKLAHPEYDDGRISFYFVVDGSDGYIISFSGFGPNQIAPSADVRLLPIDAVVLASGVERASGECLFENPYNGVAKINCNVTTDGGRKFSGQFLTDGSAPSVVPLRGQGG